MSEIRKRDVSLIDISVGVVILTIQTVFVMLCPIMFLNMFMILAMAFFGMLFFATLLGLDKDYKGQK